MRMALKWVGLVGAGVLFAGIALYVIARMLGPSPADRAALEQMAERAMPDGRNGFAALWLLPYDVPEAELDAVAGADGAAFRPEATWPREGDPPGAPMTFPSVAAGTYVDLRVADDEAEVPYCSTRGSECLERVAADPAGYAGLLQRDALLLDRIDALADFDHLVNPFPPGFDHNLPAWNLLGRINTRRAHDFLDGRVDIALAGVCRDAGMARMLARDADSFMASMQGANLLQGSAELFAGMLARLPPGHPLPSACAQAFALAAPREFSLCRVMGAEVRYAVATRPHLESRDPRPSAWQGALLSATYNHDKFDAEWARFMQQWCGGGLMALLAAEQPLPMPGPVERNARQWFGCLDNLAGCAGHRQLALIAAPAYRDYAWRHQDARARLQLVNALLWLRANLDPGRTLEEQLAALPEAIVAGSRGIRAGSGGATLEVDLYSSRPSPTWSLPLPRGWKAAPGEGP